MNVWILQDEPGVNMIDKLEESDITKPWWWNVDRYVKSSTILHIEVGDKVLVWQPYLDDAHPSGIYAVGIVEKLYYYSPEAMKRYRIDFQIKKVLNEPITREKIKENPLLREMQIIRMPGGHIVFRVEPFEWEELKRISQESLE